MLTDVVKSIGPPPSWSAPRAGKAGRAVSSEGVPLFTDGTQCGQRHALPMSLIKLDESGSCMLIVHQCNSSGNAAMKPRLRKSFR